jgi:hypothetical protein
MILTDRQLCHSERTGFIAGISAPRSQQVPPPLRRVSYRRLKQEKARTAP